MRIACNKTLSNNKLIKHFFFTISTENACDMKFQQIALLKQ